MSRAFTRRLDDPTKGKVNFKAKGKHVMKAGEAKERLEVAVTGTTAADEDAVRTFIESWPPMSKKAAEQILDKYGPPNEAMASHLIW